MTIAKLISPLFDKDGVYRVAARVAGGDPSDPTAVVATLVVVRSGAAYAVHVTDLDDPEDLRNAIRIGSAIVTFLDDK